MEEAWTLYQKKNNIIVGGMQWLKMSNASYGTLIDLSGLGLNGIEEDQTEFRIGAMTTLRQLETNEGFNAYTDGAAKKALSGIVGVQFRNLATVGGSVAGRYGFSDVCTLLLCLNTYVHLFRAENSSEILLADFLEMPYSRDIVTGITVKKVKTKVFYESVRNTRTDFPILTCAASLRYDSASDASSPKILLSIGARPQKAVLFIAPAEEAAKDPAAFAARVAAEIPTGSNVRGSAQYRSHLVQVLAERAARDLLQSD
jgi:CO/xanthine dehydrogenase FAD-binding subunit